MDRRTAVRTTAATLLAGVAGCLGSTPTTEEPPTNETNVTEPTDTAPNVTDLINSDRVDDATFAQTGDCSESGTATVEFVDREATISGCLTAHNGCAEPVFGSIDAEADVFRVVIGEEDRSGPDTLCTEALVDRGYELTLRFVDELPATIEVVHDDAEGRAVVTTVDRP
jgi:hypothetical protein